MKRMTVLLAAAAVLLSGCGHPMVPGRALLPSAAAAPGPVSLRAPVLGVDLYALSNYPAAQVRADGARTLAYLRHVLRASAVGIVWNFYAPSPRADSVAATGATLSPGNVAILTRIAQRDHLQVEYRPLIFISGPDPSWEGLISPVSPARWLDSYYRAELPYLQDAQRLGVSEFVTETEMHDMNASPLWAGFFGRVARVYHGAVSYAAWDSDYLARQPRLLPAPDLGMDMYRALRLPPSATEAAVAGRFAYWFSQLPPAVLRRTAIEETGIQARAGAYADPANLRRPGVLDEAVQANWFTAACQTVARFRLRGVFFWKVDLTDFPAHPATSLSTFEGRAGAAAIRGCARILAAYRKAVPQ
jgi:hypothetical protein